MAAFIQPMQQFLYRPGIDDRLRRGPSAASRAHTKMREFKMTRMMSIAIDRQETAQFQGPAGIDVVQVQPRRVGVDLPPHHQSHTGGGGGLENRFHIQIGAFSIRDQASGRMADNVHVPVVDRLNQAVGYFLSFLPQRTMQ